MLSPGEMAAEKVPMMATPDLNPGDDPSDDFEAQLHPAQPSQRSVILTSAAINLNLLRDHAFPAVLSFLYFLIPSFIASWLASRVQGQLTAEKPTRPHPTAWLDGIRGWAAYIVFIHHLLSFFTNPSPGWGADGTNHQWWRLPIIHILVLGQWAVCVFFIVSGFALSIKPLKQIRSSSTSDADLLATLSSSALRRPFRLYIPMLASTFLIFLFGRLGAYAATARLLAIVAPNTEHHYSVQEQAFWPDLYLYLKSTMNFCVAEFHHWNDPGGWNRYDPHMWTIPIEFRCSLLLFLTQLALARVRVAVRLVVVFALIVLAVCHDWWDILLFWAGMLLCELHMEYTARFSPHSTIPTNAPAPLITSSKLSPTLKYLLATTLHTLNTTTFLYLLSTPHLSTSTTPFYSPLVTLGPTTLPLASRWRFWVSLGAIQLLTGTALSTGRISLAALFSHPLSRYLGDISYSLYCTHALVNHLVAPEVFWAVFGVTGQGTAVGFAAGLGVSVVIISVVLVCVADVFWRAVDRGAVKVARVVEGWCLGKEG